MQIIISDGNWEEEICGRPAGLKFDPDGFLIAADMYNGIFRVDIATGGEDSHKCINIKVLDEHNIYLF